VDLTLFGALLRILDVTAPSRTLGAAQRHQTHDPGASVRCRTVRKVAKWAARGVWARTGGASERVDPDESALRGVRVGPSHTRWSYH
jgi:hypothetical protein